MRIGEIVGADRLGYGKPLDGVRVLALEQMQAMPFATQLLGRLGAEVVKVEPVGVGDPARRALPAAIGADGRPAGCTFLRSNIGKRSIAVDIKSGRGQALLRRLAASFDVFAENFKPGTLARYHLGYDDVAAAAPRCIYASLSGFGSNPDSPYSSWPAFGPIAEAMSGIYDYKRRPGEPPIPAPVGPLGDIGTALFTVVGVLAALRAREATGLGQHVDVAMFDAMVAMTDMVTNFHSMGLTAGQLGPLIIEPFRAADGYLIIQISRENQFAALARTVGHPEWIDDPRFAARSGWLEHLDDVIRPGVEGWAASMTKAQACAALAAGAVPAGPCLTAGEVVADRHVARHAMLVELPRVDGVEQPVLVPGNPIKMSRVAEGPETPPPLLGADTDDVLSADLGMGAEEIAELRSAGVVG